MLVVCDMSSNFASRPVNWENYDVVYLGAQKNLGPSGLTVVIVRDSVLERPPRKDMISTNNWALYKKAPNMYMNTPCNFAIYITGLNLAHMLKVGGIAKMTELAEIRSKMLYDYIDSSDGYYTNIVNKSYRSRMNIPFRICDDAELEAKFLAEAKTHGMIELKGHVALGGIRASLYNAMPVEGVETLIKLMKSFKDTNIKKAKL